MSQWSRLFGLPARTRRDVEMYEEDDQLRLAKERRNMNDIKARLEAVSLERAEATSHAGIERALGLKRLGVKTRRGTSLWSHQRKAHEKSAKMGARRAKARSIVKNVASRTARAHSRGRQRLSNGTKKHRFTRPARTSFVRAAKAHVRLRRSA